MSDVNKETIADIVTEMRHVCHNPTLGIKTNREESIEKFLKDMLLEYVCRIEAAYKRSDDQWRAAFAKIEEVVTLQYAKRNIGDKGKKAVAEIMSACRFPDGALDEYERAFAENARLRAALKPVLELEDNNSGLWPFASLAVGAVKEAQRIYKAAKYIEEGKV